MCLCRGTHRRRSRYHRVPREWQTTLLVGFVSVSPYLTITLVGGVPLGRFLEYVFCSLPVAGVLFLSFPCPVALTLVAGACLLSPHSASGQLLVLRVRATAYIHVHVLRCVWMCLCVYLFLYNSRLLLLFLL